MTQDERWSIRYNEVKAFIECEHRNPSKYRDEEKLMVHFLKRGRKLMNADCSLHLKCTFAPAIEMEGSKLVQKKLNISIVVPVYNVSLYIERCVRSVMAQTYPVMECIIVDDASPDDSIAKCERIIAGFNGPTQFVILHHDHNRGLSASRNTGTDAAKGDYIFYLDSDDELTPDCIEKLARPIERDPSIEMVVGNYQVFSVRHRIDIITREEELTSSEEVREFFFDRRLLYVAAWNKLILNTFLKNHSLRFMDGILYEDHPWTFYVVKYLQHLYVIPDITYNYYKRPLSITTGTDKTEEAYHKSVVYEYIVRHFTPGEEAREARYYLRVCLSHLFRNRRMEGYKRILPLFEKALAGSGNLKEKLLLWVLKLSSKSAFLHWILVILLKIRFVILYPFHRMASLWKRVMN